MWRRNWCFAVKYPIPSSHDWNHINWPTPAFGRSFGRLWNWKAIIIWFNLFSWKGTCVLGRISSKFCSLPGSRRVLQVNIMLFLKLKKQLALHSDVKVESSHPQFWRIANYLIEKCSRRNRIIRYIISYIILFYNYEQNVCYFELNVR